MKESVLDSYREVLKKGRTLLHVCCAPCSGYIIRELLNFETDFAVYFFNPNIYPFREYEKRKTTLLTYLQKHHVQILDDDYNYQLWLNKVKDYAKEPERGKRCSLCFYYRLSATAHKALDNDFQMMATTLGISRYKDLDDVNKQGTLACEKVPPVRYLDINWRKKEGSRKMYELARRELFYMQNYCGCEFSGREKSIFQK